MVMNTYSPLGDNSKISYQTRRSWITWTWFVWIWLTAIIGLNLCAGIGLEKGTVIVDERVFVVLKQSEIFNRNSSKWNLLVQYGI
jgi:hypothetical protein